MSLRDIELCHRCGKPRHSHHDGGPCAFASRAPRAADPDRRSAGQMLARARELVAGGSWCRGASARNADGEPCQPTSDRAVAWCAYGALRRSEDWSAWEPPPHAALAMDLLRRAAEDIVGPYAWGSLGAIDRVVRLNDEVGSLVDVLAMYDRAIAALMTRPAPEAA